MMTQHDAKASDAAHHVAAESLQGGTATLGRTLGLDVAKGQITV